MMKGHPFPRARESGHRQDDSLSGVGAVAASLPATTSFEWSPAEAPPRIVVIGIGNTLLGDDGVGVHVVERLRSESWDVPVEFFDGGTLSFSLLEHIECAERLIIVDAAFLDTAPGTVAVFRNDELDHFLTHNRRPSVHEVNLLDVLGAARLRGRLPAEYALVAIEPEIVDWSSMPSSAVAAAIDRARDRVAELIEEELP